MDSRYEGNQSNSTRNMKHANFVPKDVQRILSSRDSIMNRKCSTRKFFLKISQHSQENTCFGISFLIKMQAFRAPALLKRDSNTDAFLRTLRNFYEHLFWRTSANGCFWDFHLNIYLYEQIKTKQKPFENSAIWKKNLPFHDVFIISFFSFHVRRHLPYIIKIHFWNSLQLNQWAINPGPMGPFCTYYFDLWARKCCIIICIVIVNTKFVAHRCI